MKIESSFLISFLICICFVEKNVAQGKDVSECVNKTEDSKHLAYLCLNDTTYMKTTYGILIIVNNSNFDSVSLSMFDSKLEACFTMENPKTIEFENEKFKEEARNAEHLIINNCTDDKTYVSLSLVQSNKTSHWYIVNKNISFLNACIYETPNNDYSKYDLSECNGNLEFVNGSENDYISYAIAAILVVLILYIIYLTTMTLKLKEQVRKLLQSSETTDIVTNTEIQLTSSKGLKQQVMLSENNYRPARIPQSVLDSQTFTSDEPPKYDDIV